MGNMTWGLNDIARRVSGGYLLKILLLFLLVTLSSAYSSAESTDSKTVDATGVATVTGANPAQARDAAIGDALRKAVEQAIGTIVTSDTMVANYRVLSDNVYTKTQGYIKTYDVINEAQEGGLYQVRVRATVALGPLKDDLSALGILQRKAERPRVLFLVAEKSIGHKYYHFWWWGKSEYRGETTDISAAETALKEAFVKNGFTVVEASGIPDKIEVSDAFKVADLTASDAKEIGKVLNAELVVYGKAVAKAVPGTEGAAVAAYLADVTAQAVRVDDGMVLAASGGHGVSRNISELSGGTEAIAKASAELATKLIDQITARWTSGVNIITITVSGITDYQKLIDFKNGLKGRVRGIEAVYQRKFDAGVAVFEVDSRVSAQNIADDISRIAGYMKVIKTTPNTISVAADPDRQ